MCVAAAAGEEEESSVACMLGGSKRRRRRGRRGPGRGGQQCWRSDRLVGGIYTGDELIGVSLHYTDRSVRLAVWQLAASGRQFTSSRLP